MTWSQVPGGPLHLLRHPTASRDGRSVRIRDGAVDIDRPFVSSRGVNDTTYLRNDGTLTDLANRLVATTEHAERT